jgi:hypothetical protein
MQPKTYLSQDLYSCEMTKNLNNHIVAVNDIFINKRGKIFYANKRPAPFLFGLFTFSRNICRRSNAHK